MQVSWVRNGSSSLISKSSVCRHCCWTLFKMGVWASWDGGAANELMYSLHLLPSYSHCIISCCIVCPPYPQLKPRSWCSSPPLPAAVPITRHPLCFSVSFVLVSLPRFPLPAPKDVSVLSPQPGIMQLSSPSCLASAEAHAAVWSVMAPPTCLEHLNGRCFMTFTLKYTRGLRDGGNYSGRWRTKAAP